MIKKSYKIMFCIIIILIILTLNSYAKYKVSYKLTAYKIKINNQSIPSEEPKENSSNKEDFIIEIHK